MKRRNACLTLATLPWVMALPAQAQPAGLLRVAWVSTDRSTAVSPFLEAFRSGMRERGYDENRNLRIDTWWGEGSTERLQTMASEILNAQPEVFLTQGAALGAMLRAGVKKPIVFVISANPVEAKFVASYARPGGNVTGISLFDLEPFSKRLQLVREALPRVKRIAVLANPQHPGEQMELRVAQDGATKLGMTSRYFPVRTEAELERALADIAQGRDEAIVAFADAFIISYAERISAFSLKQRIPAISGWAVFAQRGNLMSYGPVITECYRRVANYVARIHKGASPGELPIELPTKLELVLNLKVAKAIGLAIPPSLLARADVVIE
jgi:putative tryptophan/tyrosine transport system substrate-binding protein